MTCLWWRRLKMDTPRRIHPVHWRNTSDVSPWSLIVDTKMHFITQKGSGVRLWCWSVRQSALCQQAVRCGATTPAAQLKKRRGPRKAPSQDEAKRIRQKERTLATYLYSQLQWDGISEIRTARNQRELYKRRRANLKLVLQVIKLFFPSRKVFDFGFGCTGWFTSLQNSQVQHAAAAAPVRLLAVVVVAMAKWP